MFHPSKKKFALVTVILTLFIAGTSYASLSRNLDEEIQMNLTASKQALTRAQILQCEYIGQLTQQCYKKRAESCTELRSQEALYEERFASAAYLDCFSEAPADLHPITSSAPNPLFLGDEGALPK